MEQVTNKVGRELIPQIPHAQPLIHNNKSTNNSAATGPSLSAQRSHFAQNNYTNITRATYAHSNQEKVSQLHVQCSMCQHIFIKQLFHSYLFQIATITGLEFQLQLHTGSLDLQREVSK